MSKKVRISIAIYGVLLWVIGFGGFFGLDNCIGYSSIMVYDLAAVFTGCVFFIIATRNKGNNITDIGNQQHKQ